MKFFLIKDYLVNLSEVEHFWYSQKESGMFIVYRSDNYNFINMEFAEFNAFVDKIGGICL